MEKLNFKKKEKDTIAAVLSIIPGLGHLYKRHYMAGLFLIVMGNILALFVALWLGFATFGLSLLVVPVAYVAGVAMSAYYLEDRSGQHHYLHPWRS